MSMIFFFQELVEPLGLFIVTMRKVAASVMPKKETPETPSVWYRDEKKQTRKTPPTPMQKAGLVRMQNRQRNAHFVVVAKRNRSLHLLRREHRTRRKIGILVSRKTTKRYRLFFHRAVRNVEKLCRFKKEEAYVDEGVFLYRWGVSSRGCQGSRGSSRPDLFCRPCLLQGRGRRNRCLLLCMSVPAKMNS
ncbi:hypothetical protein N658DRAFT_227948 [Parathielavia hyrcaniae]|uniref:Uncharacterized protein n=1 Tax=Parathielavia hyrcaniae TaxID=113614 RepID=A0AAN6SZ65_9PEZI|nr:hypothetical protein N658DRAFT_227948 [Parathielavia hyrcaniae]